MVKSRSNKKRSLGKNKSKKNVKRVRKTMKKMKGGGGKGDHRGTLLERPTDATEFSQHDQPVKSAANKDEFFKNGKRNFTPPTPRSSTSI